MQTCNATYQNAQVHARDRQFAAHKIEGHPKDQGKTERNTQRINNHETRIQLLERQMLDSVDEIKTMLDERLPERRGR